MIVQSRKFLAKEFTCIVGGRQHNVGTQALQLPDDGDGTGGMPKPPVEHTNEDTLHGRGWKVKPWALKWSR